MVEELTETAVRRAIAGRTQLKVVVVGRTESTQLLAKNYLAHHNNGGPVAFIANQQSGGYGQHGRHFYSPAGSGLYLSLLLPPQDVHKLRRAGLLTTSVAVVLANVLERYFPSTQLTLKWVNDVYRGTKKVAGILTEADFQLGSATASLIIGIGVNLTTDHFPDSIAGQAGALSRPVAVDRNQLAADLLVALIQMLADYSSGKYLPEYRRRCFLLGRRVTVKTARGVKHGVATDISKNGALVIVDSSGHRLLIHSGEVQKVGFEK